jgi:hypothetical protein
MGRFTKALEFAKKATANPRNGLKHVIREVLVAGGHSGEVLPSGLEASARDWEALLGRVADWRDVELYAAGLDHGAAMVAKAAAERRNGNGPHPADWRAAVHDAAVKAVESYSPEFTVTSVGTGGPLVLVVQEESPGADRPHPDAAAKDPTDEYVPLAAEADPETHHPVCYACGVRHRGAKPNPMADRRAG